MEAELMQKNEQLEIQKSIRRIIGWCTIGGVLFGTITGYVAHSPEHYTLALICALFGLVIFLASSSFIEDTERRNKQAHEV